MAKQVCAVCDNCRKHEELTGFNDVPEGWYARFTGHAQNLPVYCSITCLLTAQAV